MKRELLRWYRAHRRDLPWRATRDPYAVWVSEIMLQQTRVDTVRPYYERVLGEWPTVQALAAADPERVRARWSGLGYYRRAALMLRAAAVVTQEHGGRFPDQVEGLAALPGFGAYTAGAVASIAFDRPAPAVDGNVIRVLSRIALIEGDTSRGPGRAAVEALATELAQAAPADPKAHDPGNFTQALMELGALICTPKKPRCDECPVRASCRARAAGRADEIPPPRARAKKTSVKMTGVLVRRGERVLLGQREEGGLFAELWVVPLFEGTLGQERLRAAMRERHGVALLKLAATRTIKHVLTHREIEVSMWTAELSAAAKPKGLRFVTAAQLAELGLPAFTRRALEVG